jgi:hypothetical protein
VLLLLNLLALCWPRQLLLLLLLLLRPVLD